MVYRTIFLLLLCLTNFPFCLSGIRILLNNNPHGDNLQDAEMIPRAELLITIFYGFEVTINIPLLINNVVPRDNNVDEVNENNENAEDDAPSPETNPSATVSSASNTDSNDTVTSDNDSENSPDQHSNATFEDSELEAPQRTRIMVGKRKHSRAAAQDSDSTSEDEDHPVSFRTRSRCINKKPRTSRTQETSEKETFSAPSRETERLQNRKKQVTLQDKNPVDSESSD